MSPEMTVKLMREVRAGRRAPRAASKPRERESSPFYPAPATRRSRAISTSPKSTSRSTSSTSCANSTSPRVQAAVWAVEHGIAAKA